MILKGVNWLSISDFWSAWINKTVDSISIIVASWQKTKRPWRCRPRVIFTICSLFKKYPPANCLESTSKNPQSPAKLPQKLSWTGKKLWILEVFDRRQNADFWWFLTSHVIRILKERPIVEAFVHLQNTLRETLSET